MSNDKKNDREEVAEISEENRGISHTGPETVDITGAAIGQQGVPPYPSPDRDAEGDSCARGNSGVQNLGQYPRVLAIPPGRGDRGIRDLAGIPPDLPGRSPAAGGLARLL
jgi:hypothetical protein